MEEYKQNIMMALMGAVSGALIMGGQNWGDVQLIGFGIYTGSWFALGVIVGFSLWQKKIITDTSTKETVKNEVE